MAQCTKTQAKRCLKVISSKVMLLYSHGYMTTDDLIKITDKVDRAMKRMK